MAIPMAVKGPAKLTEEQIWFDFLIAATPPKETDRQPTYVGQFEENLET